MHGHLPDIYIATGIINTFFFPPVIFLHKVTRKRKENLGLNDGHAWSRKKSPKRDNLGSAELRKYGESTFGVGACFFVGQLRWFDWIVEVLVFGGAFWGTSIWGIGGFFLLVKRQRTG